MLAAWKDQRVFLNAPHGEREPKHATDFAWYPFTKWMTKASIESQRGATVLAFLPATTDRRWFHNFVSEATSIVLLEQRVKCYVPDRVRTRRDTAVPPSLDPDFYESFELSAMLPGQSRLHVEADEHPHNLL